MDSGLAIRLNPKDDEFFTNRGAAHIGLEQFERAIEDLNQATRINPKNAAAYVNRGNAFLS